MLVKARRLSGFKDRLPKEAKEKAKLLEVLTKVFASFGFMRIETPHLEYLDVLEGGGGDEINKEIYKFKDHGGRDVALRFDQTVPLARFISEHKEELGLPFKRFVIGNVFRGERAQKGRYREFTQCDFDFIGTNSISADAEIIAVIYHSLKTLGINSFNILISSRRVLNGLCHYYEVSDVESALRIIDKMDKIALEQVTKELGALTNRAKELMDALSLTIDDATLNNLKAKNKELKEGIEEIQKLVKLLAALGVDEDNYQIDFSVARGLAYYTGIVYECRLNDMPSIGSVCSGGRYDNLTKRFTNENISGVGASIGLDRLLAALEELNLLNNQVATATILIIGMDEEFISLCHSVAQQLRQGGIDVEVYPEALKGNKIKRALSYANNYGHPFISIIGEKESKEGFNLKNMNSGEQIDGLSIDKLTELVDKLAE